MRRSRNILAGSLLIACALASAQTASKPGGRWEGKIEIPEHEFSIVVDLAPAAKGGWVGSMSVLGSSSIDVPLSALTVDGATVKFAANLPVKATFEGQLSADGASLSGTATNPQGNAPFSLTRSGEARVKIPAPSSPLTREFEGLWDGSLDAGGNVLRVGVRLTRGEDGSAIATLISYTQNNSEIPATSVTLNGKEITLDVRAISGGYHGTLGENGEITGEWSEGSRKIPLTLKRARN